MKKSFIKKCVKSSGISEENLVFVNIEWMDLGDENISDYDANDFDKYEKFIDFLNQNPNVKWKNNWISFVKFLAIGVTELERKL